MLTDKVKNALTIDIDLYNTTYDVLIKTDEYVDFAAVETSLKNSINKQLDNGTDPAELRVLFTVDTQAIAYFNRLVTIHNAKESKTGKSGGGGGSKKQKTAKKTAKTAAKKTAKKSATIQEATINATLAAVRANLVSNFAGSKIDGTRKAATVADVEAIGKLVVKSVRTIGSNPEIVTDALPIAKPKPSKAKPSNGKGKTPKAHAGNRIAKALAKSE